jgi:hypothetical protein
MRYVVEWDLLAIQQPLPMTRRAVVTADNIGDAVRRAEDAVSPGMDCVSFRVHEISEEIDLEKESHG